MLTASLQCKVAILVGALVASSVASQSKGEVVAAIKCDVLSAAYCDPQFGCRQDSVDGKCFFDASVPRDVINCTQALIDASSAVATAQASLTAAIADVKVVSWGVMANTSAIMDVMKESEQKYDSAVKAYNQSLIKYNTAMFLLQQYSDALDALQKTCSNPVPAPPPTCPAQIAEMQAKIAKQNATAATLWIQVTLSKSLLDIAIPPVDAAEAAMLVATSQAAARYGDISTIISQTAAAKDDAMVYWEQIETTCGAPPPAADAAKAAKAPKPWEIKTLLFN